MGLDEVKRDSIRVLSASVTAWDSKSCARSNPEIRSLGGVVDAGETARASNFRERDPGIVGVASAASGAGRLVGAWRIAANADSEMHPTEPKLSVKSSRDTAFTQSGKMTPCGGNTIEFAQGSWDYPLPGAPTVGFVDPAIHSGVPGVVDLSSSELITRP